MSKENLVENSHLKQMSPSLCFAVHFVLALDVTVLTFYFLMSVQKPRTKFSMTGVFATLSTKEGKLFIDLIALIRHSLLFSYLVALSLQQEQQPVDQGPWSAQNAHMSE